MSRTLTTNDIAPRIARLEQLGRELADDALQWKLCDDPLTPQERREYLSCLLDAISGAETARDVLARVRKRLAREATER